MTTERAKELIPDIESFKKELCNTCIANDWYCLSDCDILKRARAVGYERILKSYVRNGGEIHKVVQFIQQARI